MKFIQPVNHYHISLPLFSHSVRAGFPSPADGYLEQALDLNEHVIQHPRSRTGRVHDACRYTQW